MLLLPGCFLPDYATSLGFQSLPRRRQSRAVQKSRFARKSSWPVAAWVADFKQMGKKLSQCTRLKLWFLTLHRRIHEHCLRILDTSYPERKFVCPLNRRCVTWVHGLALPTPKYHPSRDHAGAPKLPHLCPATKIWIEHLEQFPWCNRALNHKAKRKKRTRVIWSGMKNNTKVAQHRSV